MFLLRLLLPFKKKLLIIYDLAVNGVGFDFYIFMENALQLKKKVGLKKYANKRPSELSGGQRTRIALARVMVRSKPLLLLDEAFLGLGPALRLEMLELIIDMAYKKNTTLLMITHDVKDAIKLNQKIIFVNEGVVDFPVHISEFLNSSKDKIRQYLGR